MREYVDRMNRLDNQYRVYMAYSKEEYAKGSCHTKEEIGYLQKAIMVQAEMAQLSDGEERKYHRDIQHQLSLQLENAIREVDPEYMKAVQNRSQEKAAAAKAAAPKSAKADSKGEDGISDETVQYWFKESPKHSFDDVAGMDHLKETLKSCAADASLEKIRSYFKMPELHSFLFYGPPGCGKTYIIEAFAHELMQDDYKYMSLDCSDILSRYVGSAEKIIRRVFDEAEQNAPCILFLDEIDGVCKNRNMKDLPVWASNMTTAFLTAYNRLSSSGKKVILISATNYPTQVDAAMIDRVELINVPYPDLEARSFTFRREFKDIIGQDPDFDYVEMADRTEGYNQRDIKRLCAKIKNLLIKDVLEKYESEDQALEALQNKTYCLTEEIFAQAQADYSPSPKDAIDRELAEFAAIRAREQEKNG